MPVFAKHLLKRIEADLIENPLAPGELRLIPKMAPYCISAEPEHAGTKWLFAIDVVGKRYFIHYVIDRSEPIE